MTFRTARAAEALKLMAQDPRLVVGAGTVLTVEQVDTAAKAGARYVVTPGYSRDVVRACQDRGIPVIPGVATPTEIQMALADGITLVKFFPAEAIGGITALSAMAAPFPMLRFIPTGGISAGNLERYLALPSVVAVGGSWMVPASLVARAAMGRGQPAGRRGRRRRRPAPAWRAPDARSRSDRRKQ